jgi:hypothetical protein
VLIRFSKAKRAGKPHTIVCTRADGSMTKARSNVGVDHDLVHFALESELGWTDAFYGLLARGWSIQSFDVPAAAAKLELPLEAIHAEFVVGLFQIELSNGEPRHDFNAALAAMLREKGVAPMEPIPTERVKCIRRHIADLLARWAATPPGATLELEFRPVSGM